MIINHEQLNLFSSSFVQNRVTHSCFQLYCKLDTVNGKNMMRIKDCKIKSVTFVQRNFTPYINGINSFLIMEMY